MAKPGRSKLSLVRVLRESDASPEIHPSYLDRRFHLEGVSPSDCSRALIAHFRSRLNALQHPPSFAYRAAITAVLTSLLVLPPQETKI
jgi:hypothetical protein